MLRIRRHFRDYTWTRYYWRLASRLGLQWLLHWFWMQHVAVYEWSDDGGKTWRRL